MKNKGHLRALLDPKSVFPETHGEEIENRTLLVTGSGVPDLTKYLTVYNTSVAFQISQLKKTQKRNPYKAEQIQKAIDELSQDLLIKYYHTDEYGNVLIPIGFWYLCESVEWKSTKTIKPCYPSNARDYQVEAINALLAQKRAVAVLATGLGKTLVIAGICESALREGKRVCVIVPTIDLVSQTMGSIAKYLESISIPNKTPLVSGAGGKFKYKMACDVLISTPITAKQYVDRFNIIIADEAHHSPSATWFALGLEAKQAEYFYGLTATPVRSDNLELGIHAWCGPVVISKSARWGIENKWLTPIEVTSVMVDLHKRLPDNYSKPFAYKLATLNKVTAECLRRIIQSLLDKNHKVVVLFATIKAGKYLSDYCKTKGLEFDVSHEKYKVPFFDFKSGKTNLLVSNNKLLGEGIDIPNITAIINVCNMKSEGVARQIVGRAVRLFPGKEQAKIIDVSFNNFSQFVQFAEYRKDIYRTIVDEIKEVTYDPCKK